MAKNKPRYQVQFDEIITDHLKGESQGLAILRGLNVLAAEMHDLNAGISQLIKQRTPAVNEEYVASDDDGDEIPEA